MVQNLAVVDVERMAKIVVIYILADSYQTPLINKLGRSCAVMKNSTGAEFGPRSWFCAR